MHIHEPTTNNQLYTKVVKYICIKIYLNLIYTSEKCLLMNIQAELHGQSRTHGAAKHVPH